MKSAVSITILVFISVFLYGQDLAYSELPKGFGELALGSSYQETDAALKRDTNFYYRGEADLSMLRRPNERMIETAGVGYLRRAYLQFYQDRLYAIILELDDRIMDHYALFTSFTGKYGPPDIFNPSESRWEGDEVHFVLERKSLRVKYLDAELMEEIRRSGEIERSFQEMSRERFLEQF
jgi:hypothetical protein